MDTLSEDIALIRKCAGSPAYIGPEANRVVNKLEDLNNCLIEYLKYPSTDGRKERMGLREKLKLMVDNS